MRQRVDVLNLVMANDAYLPIQETAAETS